jgi:tetratricopeptide (TPR) repeat protein
MASALSDLGDMSLRQGKYEQAIGYLRQAILLFRQSGYQHGESVTLRRLAEALRACGQPAEALDQLTTALRLAAETGNVYEQANAHRDLASSHSAAGQDEQARHHWQQALALYTQLGAPEAGQICSHLAAASPG